MRGRSGSPSSLHNTKSVTGQHQIERVRVRPARGHMLEFVLLAFLNGWLWKWVEGHSGQMVPLDGLVIFVTAGGTIWSVLHRTVER